jgi:hypothetical protein
VGDDDLLEGPLDAQARSLVDPKETILDAYSFDVLAAGSLIRAEETHAVAEALAQDAAIDDAVFGAIFDLEAVRLIVGVRETRSVPVDDEVLEDDALIAVPDDEDVLIACSGRRIDELHTRLCSRAHDHEVWTPFRSSDHHSPGTEERETR